MGAIGGNGVSIEEALPLDGSRSMTGTVTVDQNSNALSLDIDSEATTVDIVNISPAVLTTGNVIDIPDADALTTGKIVNLVSNSADTGTRDLVKITNDNTLATGVTCLNLQQDSAQRAVFIDQNGNGKSIDIDSEATTIEVFQINDPATTTSTVLDLNNCNALTTGKILNLVGNGTDASTRSLQKILNNNSAATGATCLEIQQNAANQTMILLQNAASSFIDYAGTAAANTTDPISTLTTSGAVQGHLQIEVNGVKRWVAFLADPS